VSHLLRFDESWAKTDVNPLVGTPDFSIFCIANVKQLTHFYEYLLNF